MAWTTLLPSGPALYATRVNSNGTLATDIATPLDSNAHSVSLTAGRDGYFAAWISNKGLNAAITDSYGRIEHRVTVAQDGLTTSSQTLAAWNGAVHLVVSGFDGPFFGTLLDNNGDILQSNIPIGDTHRELNTRTAMTADTAGFLVVSTKEVSGRDEIYGRRITSSGVAGDWFLIRSVASKVFGLSVTSDGARDVIAWGDAFGVWMMSLDGQSRQLVPDSAAVTQMLVEGGRTWITYQRFPSGGEAYAITVGRDGSVTAPLSLSSASKMASNGSNLLSVSAVRADLETDIVGSFLTPAHADPPMVVSKSETEQRNGNLAGDGNNAVAVWDEKILSQHQIFAARFDSNRKALDLAGVQISISEDNIHPSAAFNGKDYLIVWTRTEQTVARRFSSDGQLLDSDDILLGESTYDGAPRVMWDGSNWLVAWVRELEQPACGNIGRATRIYATRVSPSGVAFNPGGVPIDPQASMDQRDVDLGWSESEYIITWTNFCTGYHQPTRTSIGMATLAPDFSRVRIATASTEGSNPRVAVGASQSLIAWSVNGATEFRIVDNTAAQDDVRRRTIGQHRSFANLPGSLVAVEGSSIFTQMTIPFAPLYQGLFQTTIAADGSPGTPRFLFVLEPTETLIGRLMVHGGTHWMAESMLNSIFDPAAGATRLWIREF